MIGKNINFADVLSVYPRLKLQQTTDNINGNKRNGCCRGYYSVWSSINNGA